MAYGQLADLIGGNKAYKEVKKLNTLNVNKIVNKYEDGMKLLYNAATPASRPVILKKRDTGRKDYEGNPIYHIVLTDPKREDSVVLFPKYEFLPREFSSLSFVKPGDRYSISKGEYVIYDHDKFGFYDGQHDSYTEKGYVGLASSMGTKLNYDRQDLIEAHEKKMFDAYCAYLDKCFEKLKNKSYDESVSEIMNREFITAGLSGGNYVYLKVKKTESGYTLIRPFSNGEYPEKEDFYIHIKKESNGFYRIQNKATLSLKFDPNANGEYNEVLPEYYLVPFQNTLQLVREEYLKPDANTANMDDLMLGISPIDLSNVDNCVYYSNRYKGPFEKYYKLKNYTEEVDAYAVERIRSFIAKKVIPLYLK